MGREGRGPGSVPEQGREGHDARARIRRGSGAIPHEGARHRRRGRGHAEPRRGVGVQVRGPSCAARRGEIRRRTAGESRDGPACGGDDYRRRAETRGRDGRSRPCLCGGLRRRADMTTASRSVAATVLFAGVVFGQPEPPRAQAPAAHTVTDAEYARWKKDLSNWGRWGKDDEIGALNLITPAKRKQAAALVKDGVSVSLSADADTVQAVDNPTPYEVVMQGIGSD